MRVLKPDGELRLFTCVRRCAVPAAMLFRLGLVVRCRTFVPLNTPPASVYVVVRREQPERRDQSKEPEPVVQAITARDMADLMHSWHRLERFSHGRHRVAAERIGANSFRLTHQMRDDGPPLTLAESLLVLGLLTVLSEMIGSTDVTLADTVGSVWRSDGKWHRPNVVHRKGSVILAATGKSKTTAGTCVASKQPFIGQVNLA